MGQCSGDEVDRDDPLLITTVRARLNRERKVKKVGRKIVKELVRDDNERADADNSQEEQGMLSPRRYQQQAFEAALNKNTILYLETGCGKTLVAVLLIKSLAKNTRLENDKRLIVFLAPTVILVQQQARVIRIHTDLNVGEYYGSKNVDTWSRAEWQTQIAEVEVMVMTPQVFLNNLQHGFLKMNIVELLIFDECHHAHKNHAYAQIMKGFYHVNVDKGRLPRIFGMTASPVTKKGVKSSIGAAEQLFGLEDLLKSEVFAFKDREEIEFVVPTAITVEEYYDAPNLDILAPYKEEIEALIIKFEKAHTDAVASVQAEFKDQTEFIYKLKERANRFHRDVQFCLEELGLWCASKAAEYLFKVDNGLEGFGEAIQAFKRNLNLFMRETCGLLKSAVPEGWTAAQTAEELQDAVSKGYLTPKVYHLIGVLFHKRSMKDVKRIIFVERRMAAVVLAYLVNDLQCLRENFRSESICGASIGPHTTRREQQCTMTAFNKGEINLLVATELAEEGIDVKNCGEVIRFNLPKTLRSNIQSRGRARRSGSTYIVFLERGNGAQRDQFSKIKQSELSVRDEAISRVHIHASSAHNSCLPICEPLKTYRVDCTGASVNTETSIELVNRFCSKLPRDESYTPKAEYLSQKVGLLYKCDIKLPFGSPIYEVLGEPQRTSRLAKQATALEACTQLHKAGALDDNLLPSLDFELAADVEKIMQPKNSSGFGTTAQKELHSVAEAEAFTGHWHTSSSGAVLFAYYMSFDIHPVEDEMHANFVLLIGAALDDDVSKLEIELCLTRGRKAKAKLSPLGRTTLTADQLSNAKLFQTILFNGMFSKMIQPVQENRKRKRESAISSFLTERMGLWKSNNAYLLLPAVLEGSNDVGTLAPIDWKIIQATSSVVKNLVLPEDPDFKHSQPRKRFKFLEILTRPFSFVRRKPPVNCLTFAGNHQVATSELVDVAVLTGHTGIIYPVLRVLHDTTAHSQFPGEKNREFKTYAEFFKIKHGRMLEHPNQPLLQLKQNHRPHNLLPADAGKIEGPTGARKMKKIQKTEATLVEARSVEEDFEVYNMKDQANSSLSEVEKVVSKATMQSTSVEMPPELCVVLKFSAAIVRSAYWLPSVMHRIKSVVLASQLRRSIDAPKIPVMEVLKALTTTRCNENFNMEALELFGDSFLKYAVSRKLFLESSTANEGVLSTRRIRSICNEALHKLAVDRGLSAYIRDCQFDPSRWAAPGMLAAKRVNCHCKEDNLLKPFKSTTSKVTGVFGNELLKDKIQTETIKPRIGLTCDKGHRYLCSKTISDVTEALIGAYLEYGRNCEGALKFMTWAGIDVHFDSKLMEAASKASPVDLSYDYGEDLKAFEKRIGYTFKNKYLPLEALTHFSNMVGDQIRCYQRLEFLGDAVLDFLLTRHLFTSHPTSTPGLLTSLRTASVNNERFARVAVKHRLHCYLRHGSGRLLHQIEEFVKSFEAADDDQKNSSFGLNGLEAPKVLGDLVESIAGAILVDTCFDLDKVWAVMMPLLEPIVTPATLDIHPVTELEELCMSKGYSIKYGVHKEDECNSRAIYEVQISDELFFRGESCKPKKKTAKKDAAVKVLAKLKRHACEDKLGHEIVNCKQEIETCEALGNSNSTNTAQVLPNEKKEPSSAISTSSRGVFDDCSQTHKCRDIPEKEIIGWDQKLASCEVLANFPPADMSQIISDEKSQLCSTPSTVVSELGEGLQGIEVRTRMLPTVGLSIQTDTESLSNTTQTKNSSLVTETCTMLATTWGGLQPKGHNRSENGSVEDAIAARHDVGEGPAKLHMSASKHDSDKVPKVLPIPAAEDLISTNTLIAIQELSKNTLSEKRLESEDDGNRSSKMPKYYWSREVAVTNSGTISDSSTVLHSTSHNLVKPSDEVTNLLDFCPWTAALPSGSSICEVQSQTTTSAKPHDVVDVLKGDGIMSSFQPRSPVRANDSKLSNLHTIQGAKCSSKPVRAAPANCRQHLNELRMKNKWLSLAFKLINEESTHNVPRFRFSLTVDTGDRKSVV